MLLLPINRENLLHFLPKGGCVAEIGVLAGGFSQHILEKTNPSCLHLIDPWKHQDRPDYAKDIANTPDDKQAELFSSVLQKFSKEIHEGGVKIHRDTSQNICNSFPDEHFDWIYIDAVHSYEGVKGDLENFKNKVKHDGFIIGHDYTNLDWAKAQAFGVIEAVNEFVVRNGWYFVALTMEEASTYVISRNMFLERTKLLFHQLIYNIPNIIEIRNHPRDEFFYKNLYFNTEYGHQRRVLMSF